MFHYFNSLGKAQKEVFVLGFIILLGLIHGLLYIFLIPPWQHYDEPGHFEYAWLAANQPKWPKPGDYNQAMRREVAASMIENHFFQDSRSYPNLISQSQPIWIGISQLSDPPFYYFLVSIPLRLLRYSDIELQLYTARFVSLLLYLVTILFAWGIAREITSPASPLRWMIPTTLVLMPGFIDLMTAVNNDVAAVVVFSLFLFFSIRLLKRLTIFNIFGTAVVILLALITKRTIFWVVPLVLVVFVLTLFRAQRRWIAWALLSIGFISIILSSFAFDNAAYWNNLSSQNSSNRVIDLQGAGNHVLQLISTAQVPSPGIYQWIPDKQLDLIRGKTITIGAWMWASEPVLVRGPYLSILDKLIRQPDPINLSTKPTFVVIEEQLPDVITHAWLTLSPFSVPSGKNVKVFYDDLVAIPGDWSSDQEPEFNGKQGSSGMWGQKEFHNLVRNASAETSWPRIRSWVGKVGSSLFPGQPSLILSSMLDLQGTGWYFRSSAKFLFETYWGRFGWGHVQLEGAYSYWLLAAFTFIALLGASYGLWRRRRTLSWDIFLILALSLITVWGSAWIRGIPTMLGNVFLPSARYAFPVIIPTVICLCAGWMEVFRLLRLKINSLLFALLYGLPFVCLDFLALFTIFQFYH